MYRNGNTQHSTKQHHEEEKEWYAEEDEECLSLMAEWYKSLFHTHFCVKLNGIKK